MKNNVLIVLLLLILSPIASGDQFGYESHQIFSKEVASDYEKTYRDVLQQYDEHINAHPQDVLAITEKCQFINSYTYAESDLLYFESLSDDFAQCETQIQQHPEDHPDKLLYDIQYLWGEDATEQYNEIRESGINDWTLEQQVRFFQWIENTQKWSENYDTSIPHAGYEATQDAQFTLGAAMHEAAAGNTGQAMALLEGLQLEVLQDRIRLAQLYIDLKLPEQASLTLSKIEKEQNVNEVTIIKLKASIDKNYSPSTSQLTAIKEAWDGDSSLKELFEHAIKTSNQPLAIKTYQNWYGDDYWQDPFNYHKYRLYQNSGQWDWGLQDFYAALGWLAVMLICFMLAFIVIAPIHYRGLYRRVHGKQPLQSLTHWNLKHGLYLLTMFFLSGTLLALIFQYEGFYGTFFTDEEVSFSSENGLNAKLYLIDALIMVIMSLLIFKNGRSLFKINATELFKSLFMTVGIFILFKFAYIALMFVGKLATPSTTFDLVQLTITDIYSNYGAIATFLTIAFLTPLIEEYLFRGVLLNSFTKHISFGWANTIQAALFAVIHDNPDHYIHHFLFGLIVGYMVKTQKHLYGAIMFHMINNALAVLVLVMV